MAATIDWTSGDGNDPIDPTGAFNGVGFFGNAFGQSVRVGEYQDSTFQTNDAGAVEGGEMLNDKYISSSGVKIGAGSIELLSAINCNETTLMIRLTNATPIQTQNTTFRAYDRLNINSNPSGITVQAFEAASTPSGSLSGNDSSLNSDGDTTWTAIAGSGATLSFIEQSGSSTDHYFYIGLSCSPTSIGEKLGLGFHFESEYL